jgi:hypothetical protein
VFGDFNPDYRSRYPGSPWTGKRHGYSVHVYGTRISGQSFHYSAAIPLTDRECMFIYERQHMAQLSKVDYQYGANVMDWVYYTDRSDRSSYEDLANAPGMHVIPVAPDGGWEPWHLRDDTVKYAAWGFLPGTTGLSGEILEPVSTQLAIASGTYGTGSGFGWNKSTHETEVNKYTITTLCSSLGGEYPFEMKGMGGSEQMWEETLPSFDPAGVKCAHLWCTRSVLGTEGAKQNIYLHGGMNYSGVFNDKLRLSDKTSRWAQVTFVGVT